MAGLGSNDRPFGEGIGQAIISVNWGGTVGLHVEYTISGNGLFNAVQVDGLLFVTGKDGLSTEVLALRDRHNASSTWTYSKDVTDIDTYLEAADIEFRTVDGVKFVDVLANAFWVTDNRDMGTSTTYRVWSQRATGSKGSRTLTGPKLHEVVGGPVTREGGFSMMISNLNMSTGMFTADAG